MTTEFCTRHDNVTILTCVKLFVIHQTYFQHKHFKILLDLELYQIIFGGTGTKSQFLTCHDALAVFFT